MFHVHSPLVNGATGQDMLPQVIDALHEIAFAPQFLTSRVEKERRAVLAESRMMNTIEYRVDCSLLQFLHEENNLGKRFPGRDGALPKHAVRELYLGIPEGQCFGFLGVNARRVDPHQPYSSFAQQVDQFWL